MKFVLITLSLLIIWSVIIEPRWVKTTEINTIIPNSQIFGLKVVHVADWHLSKKRFWRIMTHERATKIIESINNTKPDIVLITGDLIAELDQEPSFADTIEEEIAITLSKIKANIGVYAALGNHDNWYSHNKIKAALKRCGIHVLENESLYLVEEKLWIVGVRPHLDRDLSALDLRSFSAL